VGIAYQKTTTSDIKVLAGNAHQTFNPCLLTYKFYKFQRLVKNNSLPDLPFNENQTGLEVNLNILAIAVVKAILVASKTQKLDDALIIRDELRRLPDSLVTEVLNGVILNLVKVNPTLCRWFILDIFLRDADPEGKADVAERINLLIADLQSH
jgi:hypothetical protein